MYDLVTYSNLPKGADVATKPKEEDEENKQSGAGVITSSDRLGQTRHHSDKERKWHLT